MEHTPHPKNAPGPFYVEDGFCLSCEAPESEAPDLMAHDWDDEDTSCHSCYFRKQPQTPDEVRRAVMAVYVSCCGAVRYAGDDPAVLRRLRNLRKADACDQLEPFLPKDFYLLQSLWPRDDTPPLDFDGPHPLRDPDLDGDV